MRNEEDQRLDALFAMPKYHEDMKCVESFKPRLTYPPKYELYQIRRPGTTASEPACVQVQAAYMSYRDGLELVSIWKIDFSHHQVKSDAFTQIQDLLEPFHVWLCPHRRLHDAAIVSQIVSLAVPRQRDPDPVRRLEKEKELRHCQSCESIFEFRRELEKSCRLRVTRTIKGKT